jgi:hypothetical protein
MDVEFPVNDFPLVIVPNTFEAGQEASFELMVYSPVKLKLDQVF